MITLTEIMRQKDDLAFAEMLNRIRVKQKQESLSAGDKALLSRRVTAPADCPNDVLHIFATNKQVDEHNKVTIAALHTGIINIDAHDYRKDPTTGRMARQRVPFPGKKKDLQDTLIVAEGARVMLTRNIDVEDGLVNGSFGKVAKIVTQVEDDITVVKMLALQLDNEHAGQRHRGKEPGEQNLVFIDRVEENMARKGTVRRQFPMKLAYACTTHKVQGMTSTSAVVSLKRVFESGMAYVALSRTTSLAGLHLTDFDERKIYADPGITTALESMPRATCDNVMPLLKRSLTTDRAYTLTVIHHNTEGLLHHIDDIKSHHELRLADILCVTETHLSGAVVPDSLQLEGYNMFKRNRENSYNNSPQRAKERGGGVAIYLKSHLQGQEKRYVHNVTDLEFVVVKVEAPVSMLIAAVYRPPDYNLRDFLQNLRSLLDALEIMDHHPIIVCGDFNQNLMSNASKSIAEMFQAQGFTQLIEDATTEGRTLLDHIYISRPHRCIESGILQTYYSYHNPVYCVLNWN